MMKNIFPLLMFARDCEKYFCAGVEDLANAPV